MHRPLFIPILSFFLGIAVAGLFGIYPTAGIAISALSALALLSVLFIRKTLFFYAFLCAFFLVLGAFRYTEQTTPRTTDVSNFVSGTRQKALLSGTVISDPEFKGASYAKHLDFTLRAGKLLLENNELSVTGTVIIKLYAPDKYPRIGDRIVIGGEISLPEGRTNPAGFDYRDYLNNMGVRAIMSSSGGDHYMKTGVWGGPVTSLRRVISAAREKAGNVFGRYLSGVPLAVMKAVILGQRGDISAGANDIFVKTGTMHVLAVSGLHVGIVAAVILILLRLSRCPRNISYALAILGMFAFAVFAGCRPSSMRAAIMGSFILFGLMLGRKADILNSLAVSAFLITFFRPGQLFLAGFILSYLAVLSIIYVTPFTDKLLGAEPRRLGDPMAALAVKYMLKALSVSLAVTIGMMPAIAHYFRIITPLAVVINLLAIPTLFIMIPLGFFLLAVGPFGSLAPLAGMISAFLNSGISLFITTLRKFSATPFSFTRVSSPDTLLIALFYAVLALLIVFSEKTKRARTAFIVFILFAANLFVWNEAAQIPPGSAKVTFFDVGKADTSMVEFADGGVMLVDGGPGEGKGGMDAGRNTLAPYLWQRGIRKIDCVVLTHPHADHIGGLFYILQNFNIGCAIDGYREQAEPTLCHPERAERVEGSRVNEDLYTKFLKIIADKNIQHLVVERGDVIKGFKDTDLFVLNPPKGYSYGDLNNDSVVMKMTTPTGGTILFGADVEEKAIRDILRFGSFLKSNVMKVPHHGQGLGDAAATRELIKVSDPDVAVITNKDGEKLNKGLLEQLRKQGVEVYVTGTSGAVVVDVGQKIRSKEAKE